MIIEARPEDLAQLGPLALEFYASSEFLKDFNIDRFKAIWTDLMKSQLGVIFLYESEGEIKGGIGGMVHQDIYGKSIIAEEFFWFISAEARGHGISLYRAFENWARSRGASSIQMVHLLDLMPEKVSAFYRRSGFTPIETRYSKVL